MVRDPTARETKDASPKHSTGFRRAGDGVASVGRWWGAPKSTGSKMHRTTPEDNRTSLVDPPNTPLKHASLGKTNNIYTIFGDVCVCFGGPRESFMT